MIETPQNLESLISEYRNAIQEHYPATKENTCTIRTLCEQHDWTPEGAGTILALANDYGAFVLRNALALAIALDKEDGDLGI